MMIIRFVIVSFILCLNPVNPISAFPLSEQVRNPNSNYVKHYYTRFFKWWIERVPDNLKYFSLDKRDKLFELLSSSKDWDIDFNVGYEVSFDKIIHYISWDLSNMNQKQFELSEKIISQRLFLNQIHKKGKFKIKYFLESKKIFFLNIDDANSYTEKNIPKNREAKYPFYPGIKQIVTFLKKCVFCSESEFEEWLELKSFNLIYLSMVGQKIAFSHEAEFGQWCHRVKWKSKNEYSLQYP